VLRQLADEAGIGIALVGEPPLGEAIRGNRLAALRNRLAAWVELPIIREEVEAYFRHHELPMTAVPTYHTIGRRVGWHGIEEAVSKARILAGDAAPTHSQLVAASRVGHSDNTKD
jgi:hypothetical protein